VSGLGAVFIHAIAAERPLSRSGFEMVDASFATYRIFSAVWSAFIAHQIDFKTY
jgi:hypothetical protein